MNITRTAAAALAAVALAVPLAGCQGEPTVSAPTPAPVPAATTATTAPVPAGDDVTPTRKPKAPRESATVAPLRERKAATKTPKATCTYSYTSQHCALERLPEIDWATATLAERRAYTLKVQAATNEDADGMARFEAKRQGSEDAYWDAVAPEEDAPDGWAVDPEAG